MNELEILKINGIGNMISIEDMKNVILDAMSRSTNGSDVWNTYNEMLIMLTSISNEYDAEIVSENIIAEIFSKN